MHIDALFSDLRVLLYLNHRPIINDHIALDRCHLVNLNQLCFPMKTEKCDKLKLNQKY